MLPVYFTNHLNLKGASFQVYLAPHVPSLVSKLIRIKLFNFVISNLYKLRYSMLLASVLLTTSCQTVYASNIGSWRATWLDVNRPDTIRLAAALSLCSKAGYLWTKPDSIIYYSQEGFEFATEIRDTNYMILLLVEQGKAIRTLGRPSEALEVLEAAESIAKASGIREYEIQILTARANVYQQLGALSRAIDLYYQVLFLQEQADDEQGIVGTKLNIGLVQLAMEQYQEAIENFEGFLNYYEPRENQLAIVTGLQNLAAAYFEQGNYDKALGYYHQLIPISMKNNFEDIGNHLYGRGVVYFKLGEPEAAENSFHEALSSIDQVTNKATYAAILLGLAHLRETDQPDSAIVLAESALVVFERSGLLTYKTDASELLSKLYEGQGEYAEAIRYFKIFIACQDSLRGEKTQRAIFKEQAEYNYEKIRLADLAEYERKVAIQRGRSRIFTYSIAIGGLCLILFISVAWLTQKKARKIERDQLLQRIEHLKKQFTIQSIGLGIYDDFELNRAGIERVMGNKLNQTSWNILNAILQDPIISNHDIASKLFLSVEGISSSLRKMYAQLQINSDDTQNMKIALLATVIKISLDCEDLK